MTFTTTQGEEISYIEYYEKKYDRKLKYPNQPLLIYKRKNLAEIHLIPELCVLTGQTPEMRQNFQLQKELSFLIKPGPSHKLESMKGLINSLESNTRSKELLKEWDISFSKSPLKVESLQIDAGNLLMGNNVQFPLHSTSDLDRKIQNKMLKQPELKRVGIFFSKRDQGAATNFKETLKECTDTFSYPMDPPRLFPIDWKDFNDWETVFQKNLNPSVQAVILLLPGKKKSGVFYDECKKYFLTKCPIPSQVVLASTITAGKNLRSIVNKVLIQLCAKVGGTPWSITNIPFTEKPTMIIGIDSFHKSMMKNKSILAYCATMDRNFSKYWSSVQEYSSYEDLGKAFQTMVENSMLAFQETNKPVFPQRIIVYRDGVTESMRRAVHEIEIKAFLKAFQNLKENNEMQTMPDFIFINVNKASSTKFFSEDRARGGLSNPPPGTAVASEITDGNDFYLISQKILNGSANPTHYSILKYMENVGGEYLDKTNLVSEDLMNKLLAATYKFCYLYYNFSGAIKVPAPLQYANKLGSLVGERWKPNDVMIPDPGFQKIKSLYFI